MNDFDIWITILGSKSGSKVRAAITHIREVEKFSGHSYHPGRRARLLTLAQTLDEGSVSSR